MTDNFVITQQDLTDSVTFLEQFISVKLPQYDFSEGTANRDIVINALAYHTAFFRHDVDQLKVRQSLLKLQELDSDQSADEMVDEKISDWFVQRKTGNASIGYATIRFSRKDIGVVAVNTDDVFKRNGMSFNVNSNSTYVIQTTDLKKNTDNLGTEYYTMTIPLIATDVGESYDVDPGPFEEYPKISPYILGVQNIEKFKGGASIETSSELINRTKNAITVRDLNTEPSIQTVLTDKFSQVLEVSPMGMGDPEMQRDLISVLTTSGIETSFHRGSMIDAYVKFPIEFNVSYAAAYPEEGGLTVQQYQVNGVSITAVKLPDFPIYKIKSLIDNTGDVPVDVPYTIVTADITTWNSKRQSIYLIVSSAFNNIKLDLVYDTVTGYSEVQTYVEDRRNRVAVSDLLVKASFGLYLNFELRYYPSSSNPLTDLAASRVALQAFIHGRTLGEDFRVSEITDKFSTLFVGNVVQFPFRVVGALYMPNGKSLTMTYNDKIAAPVKYYYDDSSPDIIYPLFEGDLDPANKTIVVLSDLQISNKTLRYVSNTDDIKLTSV